MFVFLRAPDVRSLLGLCLSPAGELTTLPQMLWLLVVFKGPTSKGRDREGEGGKRKERRERGRGGRGL